MNQTLSHRGPDDEGYHVEGSVGLGQRRLSIIDLSTGKQPIYNEDRSICIVFNGEIYNFKVLRDQLQQKDHIFTTNTDTEAIVHAYEEWGEKCLQELRGMFAFAIWDFRLEQLFLARDRLGIKPLYYAQNNNFLAFGSEIKALLQVPEITKDVDSEAVSDYLSLGYIPAPKSIFQTIRKLPAGHYMVCTKDRLFIKEYWDISFSEEQGVPEGKWLQSLEEVLHEAVQMRLISDVPLGAFLSGGIDSSLVTALMASCNGQVLTNSIGFSLDGYSELQYARQTSEILQTRHHEYTVDPDALDVVERLAYYYDEPFADSSSVPTYYVSKMARQNVTVCLAGDGGDENFAGYRRYYFDRLENTIRHCVPSSVRKSIFGGLGSLYPKADWLPQPLRAKTLFQNVAKDPLTAYCDSVSQLSQDLKSKLLSRDLQHELSGYNTYQALQNHFERSGSSDPLSKVQYLDIKTYLVDDILTKVDRASMANSLEVRVPLLDHKVMELAAQIPASLKLRGREGKYILKKVAARHLPQQVVHRKKMGFSMPVKEWLRSDLRPLGEETILSAKFKHRGLFDQNYAQWMWNQHQKGLRDFSRPLWSLLTFELWAQKYLDQS
jgi:asparagine synthase (glutamine-hydrolysing)